MYNHLVIFKRCQLMPLRATEVHECQHFLGSRTLLTSGPGVPVRLWYILAHTCVSVEDTRTIKTDHPMVTLEEEGGRIPPLDLATREGSNSLTGKILMTGGTIGMSQAGQNLRLRRNLAGKLVQLYNWQHSL